MGETITIQRVYEELKKIEKEMATKNEIEALMNTISIMGNPKTMDQIVKSMEDIKAGKVRTANSVKDIMK